MHIGKLRNIVGGVLIFVSVILGHYVSPSWYLFTAIMGLNMLQCRSTACSMTPILKHTASSRATQSNESIMEEKNMQGAITLNDSNFDSEVLNSSIPVAVDFWATWCGPCRMLSPIMEEVASEMSGVAKVCKLNVDENPAIAGRYQIMSIPAILIFKNGQIVDQFVGARPKQDIIDRLKKQA